LNRVSI